MIAYLDLPSGLSGDMMLGCLLDAGWPVERLREVVRRLQLPVSTWRIEPRRVMKAAVAATYAGVEAAEADAHRHLRHIRDLIEAADLPAEVKQRSVAVFTRLADAEAKVHGMARESVHFHEVGAVDSIIDIVGSVAGLRELGVSQLYASALPLGGGWVETAHGRVPLPAPATLELVASAAAPTCPAPGPGEWVTPTGAALVAELARFEQPAMSIQRIGVGAGKRDSPWPNVARLWLGEPAGGETALVELRTNIDDMNPQLYAAVCQRLFAAGARDVWLTPIQMKKGRPGVLLSVLSPAEVEASLVEVLLRETTTLGVRVLPVARRHEARRELRTLDTPLGAIGAKAKWVGGQPVGVTPEYDDCVRLATSAGVPLKQVYDAATAAALALLASLRGGGTDER
jgi:uncharacterized protein (TIGR00299 family) protein